MTEDKFAFSDSVTSPARDGFAIIPNDTAEFASVPKAIYVGTGGEIVARLLDSSADLTFRNIADGTILDIRPLAIRATGTSAADIVGLL